MSESEYGLRERRLRGAGNVLKATVNAKFIDNPDSVVKGIEPRSSGLKVVHESAICLTSLKGMLHIKRERKIDPYTNYEYAANYGLTISTVDLEQQSQEQNLAIHQQTYSIVDKNYPKFHEFRWRFIKVGKTKQFLSYPDLTQIDATEDAVLDLAEQIRQGDLLNNVDAEDVTDKIHKTPHHQELKRIINGSWRNRLLNYIVPPPQH